MQAMKKFLSELKRIDNVSLKDALCPGYVFNRWIFFACFFVCVALALVVMNNHDWDFSSNFYYHCPEGSGGCVNPWLYPDGRTYFNVTFAYEVVPCPIFDETFCNTPWFAEGYTYGERVPQDVKDFPGMVLGVFFAGFVLNHFLFNKRGARK